jgi:hypothetical protein
MTKPDFETACSALRKRLKEIDFPSNHKMLGAEIHGNDLVIPFYGIPHRISPSGVTDMAGSEIHPAIAIVFYQYVLHCPQVFPLGAEERVSFREFAALGPLSGYFVENTQKLIAGTFGGKIAELQSRCRTLCGVLEPDDNASYDLSIQFNALPRIPVFLRFNDRDEAFPAQCAFLFRRSAALFLDLQGLCICATFLAGSLIGEPDVFSR